MNDIKKPMQTSDIDEVNLVEVFNALIDSKKFIVSFSLLVTLIGIIYSLMAPKIWTSSTLLTIAESSNSSFSNSSAMGGLASIASLGMSDGNSKKGSKAIAIAQSREFFDHLLTFEDVLINLMAVQSFNHEDNSNVYDDSIYDAVNKRWIIPKPPNWIAYKVYNDILSISFDNKSNFVTASVSHRSPKFSQEFLQLIIRELNSLSRNRALNQSQASLNYLYDELSSSQLNDVRLAISQLIETQLKTQMLARVKVDYALETIDKPYYPNERSSPQRKKITFTALFLGVFLSIFSVLIRFFLKKALIN